MIVLSTTTKENTVKIENILEGNGFKFVYNEDECNNVFQKIGTDEYMTGYFIDDTTVNLCLWDSFFNKVTFDGNVEKFVREFTETFNRLFAEWTAE